MTNNQQIRDADLITRQMLIAARRQDWEQVMQMEYTRRLLLDKLRAPLMQEDISALQSIADANQQLLDSLSRQREDMAVLIKGLEAPSLPNQA